MKQRPILFNGAMVRAILDGSKTQTRRLVKPHGWTIDQMSKYEFAHVLQAAETSGLTVKQPAIEAYAGFKLSPDATSPAYFKCPFGTVGGQLWVRENFQPIFADDVERHETDYETGKGYAVRYPATDEIIEWVDGDDRITSRCPPSIHMPRWASRIQLEITSIRVECLQDISEEDAKVEGVMQIGDPDFERPEDRDFKLCPQCGGTGLYTYHSENGAHPDTDCTQCDSHKKLFKHLWTSTGGDWEANPWVWVIDFKRVEQ